MAFYAKLLIRLFRLEYENKQNGLRSLSLYLLFCSK